MNWMFISGVIKLREPLDREEKELIDVVVTIQDENYINIVPFRRRIKGTGLKFFKKIGKNPSPHS